ASRAQELVAFRVPADARTEHARLKRRPWLAGALEREQRGPNEELEADERRDRIPRQPEDEGLAAHAERDRLARLHRDAPEHLFDPELRLDPADEVMRADRDTARREQDVCTEPALERLAVRALVVRH